MTTAAASADVVFVGSKVPYAVILNLTSYEVINKEHGVVQRKGEELGTVTLKGNVVPFGKPDLSIGGYVFTPVPKEFWEAWLKTHADFPMLKDGFIKVANTMEAAKKVARDHEKERGMFPRLTQDDERTKGLKVKPYDQKDEAA